MNPQVSKTPTLIQYLREMSRAEQVVCIERCIERIKNSKDGSEMNGFIDSLESEKDKIINEASEEELFFDKLAV